MNGKQHLFLDAIGQVAVIIVYSMIMGNSENPLVVLQLLPIVLMTWQLINGTISYKFFEKDSKRSFLYTAGWTLLCIFIFLGALWFLVKIPGLALYVDQFARFSFPIIWMAVPFIFAIFALWYLIITIKDVYHQLFNTI